MDIRCERCATEYELDEAQVPDAGLPIKCANCSHVFTVFKPAPPSATLRLMRNGSPMLLPCPDEQTLEQWIRESRIISADEISFDGATWERLADIPEVAGLFAPPAPPPMVPAPVALPSLELGEKTPSLHGAPLGASLPSLALPTEFAAPKLSLPTDATVPDLPKLTLPSLSLPEGTTPSLPKLSLPTGSTADDSMRTVQVKGLTADQIASLQSGTGDTSVSLGKIGRPVEGGKPVSSLSPLGPVIPSAQPVSAPRAAPKETAPVASSLATKPAEPKADKKAEKKQKEEPKKPEPKKEEAKAEKKPVAVAGDTELEIAAFKNQGRGGRIAAMTLGGLALLGGAGYYGWQQMQKVVPESAKAAYAKGRDLYLTDTRAKFPEAEAAFQQALKLAGKAPYADPLAGLAELHAAWGEPLYVKGTALREQFDAKQEEAKKAPENKELAAEISALGNQVNEVNKEASEHLKLAAEFAEKAKGVDRENVAARRAVLDFFRLKNDEAKAQSEIRSLAQLNATDAETAAHIAAVPKATPEEQQAAVEKLTASIQANPKFVRAYVWLADLHLRAKQEAEAAKVWSDALSIAPGHEGAIEALAVLKPAEPAAPETKPEEKQPAKVAEAKPAEKKPVEAKPVEQKPAEPKTAEVKTADAKSTAKAVPVAASLVDVDATLNQADTYYEKGNFKKALELYVKATEARPTSAEAHFGAGSVYLELRKYDSAVTYLRKALDRSPRFGDAMVSLAEAYKAKGAKADASKYFQQYLDMYPSGPYATAARQNLAALK